MNESTRKTNLVPAVLVLVSLPLLIWGLEDFTRRTVLKEALSILTLLAFFLMLGQFFLTRTSKIVTKGLKRSRTIKIHKTIGYSFVGVLFVHPFLIVFPRYFESGITPGEAFVVLITTFQSPGVVAGLVAWCIMLILGLTALLRKQLPMRVKTWRLFHGILSMLFIILASWHAIDLGRHTSPAMSFCIIVPAAGGVLLLLKTYSKKNHTAGARQFKELPRKSQQQMPEWGASK